MIRKLLNGDIDRIADIWLKTNLKAHYFISNQYWKSNYELVKEMMSQSEVYVFEADKMIQGFVGLNDEYIEGIFVSEEMQSCGTGKLLLDYIMMPELDGLSVCKELRKRSSDLGIIMLSAKTQEMDKVKGLMLGADDYVTKPFSPAELTARIDALFRRTGGEQDAEDTGEIRQGPCSRSPRR